MCALLCCLPSQTLLHLPDWLRLIHLSDRILIRASIRLQRLLQQHAPGSLLEFLFRHGRAAAACELLYPPSGASNEQAAHVPDGRCLRLSGHLEDDLANALPSFPAVSKGAG